MNEQSNTVINPDKADSIATFQLDLIYINDILVKDLKSTSKMYETGQKLFLILDLWPYIT